MGSGIYTENELFLITVVIANLSNQHQDTHALVMFKKISCLSLGYTPLHFCDICNISFGANQLWFSALHISSTKDVVACTHYIHIESKWVKPCLRTQNGSEPNWDSSWSLAEASSPIQGRVQGSVKSTRKYHLNPVDERVDTLFHVFNHIKRVYNIIVHTMFICQNLQWTTVWTKPLVSACSHSH